MIMAIILGTRSFKNRSIRKTSSPAIFLPTFVALRSCCYQPLMRCYGRWKHNSRRRSELFLQLYFKKIEVPLSAFLYEYKLATLGSLINYPHPLIKFSEILHTFRY